MKRPPCTNRTSVRRRSTLSSVAAGGGRRDRRQAQGRVPPAPPASGSPRRRPRTSPPSSRPATPPTKLISSSRGCRTRASAASAERGLSAPCDDSAGAGSPERAVNQEVRTRASVAREQLRRMRARPGARNPIHQPPTQKVHGRRRPLGRVSPPADFWEYSLDGLLYNSYSSSVKTAVDITISCPTNPTYVTNAAAASNTYVTGQAEKAKHLKYKAIAANVGVKFSVIAFTTYGGWGEEFRNKYVEPYYKAELKAAKAKANGGDGWEVAHLELRRSLCDRTGGEDIRIGKPRVETHWATMDDGRGSGKTIHIYGPKPYWGHTPRRHCRIRDL
eukprot:scaffold1628_cov101-Isochrysis_galbana.AAC.1